MRRMVPTCWFLGMGTLLVLLSGCTTGEADCVATATCPPPFEDAGDIELDAGPGEAGLGQGELPLGADCSSKEECSSQHCVDGKCCESGCDGPCERCDVEGEEGQCAATADGLDPDGDCSTGEGSVCDGVCDGARGCRFPAEGTPCGAVSCDEGVQTGQVCDGEGGCVEAQTSCGFYTCGADGCRSSCQSNTECAASAYCADGECWPLGANGDACSGDEQCQSGICVDGVCCMTQCEAPLSCSSGECLCNGASCAEGKECTVYVLDRDKDGYPASSEHDVVGCSDMPPADFLGHKYVDSKGALLDCDDSDPDVHPEQTKYFSVARANGSFDYDCDGIETKQFGVGALLRQCTVCPVGEYCVIGLGLSDNACSQVVAAAYENPTLPPDCGKPGKLVRCEPVGICQGANRVSETVLQGCR